MPTQANKTTVFSARMDSSIKKGLDEFCAAVGMNTNTALNMFARYVVKEQRLPFEVSADEMAPMTKAQKLSHLFGVLSDDQCSEITKALKDTEKIDINEW